MTSNGVPCQVGDQTRIQLPPIRQIDLYQEFGPPLSLQESLLQESLLRASSPRALSPRVSSPYGGIWHINTRALAEALVFRQRSARMVMLQLLGFTEKTSEFIFRYWVALKRDAPTGGPYDLLGVALATIAELGEPEMRTSCGDAIICREMIGCSTSEWERAFAEVLNLDGLRGVWEAGAYFAPDFTKAKWLVNRMLVRRWEELSRPRESASIIDMIRSGILRMYMECHTLEEVFALNDRQGQSYEKGCKASGPHKDSRAVYPLLRAVYSAATRRR
ncbi:hypothetical protein F5Y14DRAFT_450858 [Nemania sp. NC0429]|nr:hypothetical protein F5Y14DRAFT_450858 [Nemania sp. NC0429]